MRLLMAVQGLIFAAILFAGTGRAAQTEQWLQYRTTPEPQGYRWIELTNAAPAGVTWPKLSAQAHYGKWQTALDTKGERWICVDRVAKTGPCDRLYVDSNGNGRLDDETPFKATRRDEYMAYFDPAKLVFKGGDGSLTYHLACRFYQYGTNRAQLLTGSGCVYEGKVNLGGKKRVVQLLDSTVNGTFDDISPDPYQTDRIVVDGPQGTSRYLGRLLEVDNQLFAIEVPRDGAFIKVQPAGKVPLGTVRLPEAITEVTVVGTNGHFTRKPAKGETTIPAGTYRVNGWSIQRKDSAGATWNMAAYGFGSFAQFDASQGELATLRIGEPIKTVLQATQNKGEISFSLRMQGSLGESVQIMKGSEQAPAPRLQLAVAPGEPPKISTFQYG